MVNGSQSLLNIKRLQAKLRVEQKLYLPYIYLLNFLYHGYENGFLKGIIVQINYLHYKGYTSPNSGKKCYKKLKKIYNKNKL